MACLLLLLLPLLPEADDEVALPDGDRAIVLFCHLHWLTKSAAITFTIIVMV